MPGSARNGRPSTETQKGQWCLLCGPGRQKEGVTSSLWASTHRPSAFIESRHREGPGKLLHLLPEAGQTLPCFRVLEEEGFEILELG